MIAHRLALKQDSRRRAEVKRQRKAREAEEERQRQLREEEEERRRGGLERSRTG